MPRKKKVQSNTPEIIPKVTRRPSLDPDTREQQLINEAYTLAEKQLIEGTASSAVISHFLKRGSGRERAEMDVVKAQARLTMAKANNLASTEDKNKLYEEAIRAFSEYGSNDN